MRTLAALLIALLVSACATESEPAFSPERFLQIRSKNPDVLQIQITLENGPECHEILDLIRSDFDNPSFPGTSASCGATPESVGLPFRATLRNGRIKVIFDIKTDNLDHCKGAVAFAMQGETNAEDIDLLRTCQEIAGH